MSAAALLAGCGSAPTPTPPGPVALAYTRALLDHQADVAKSRVLPSDRNYFQILANLIAAKPRGTEDLAVGSTAITGSTSLVVLTGQVCLPAATSGPAPCQTNTDIRSTNSLFQVKLTRQRNTWYVYYPNPQ